MIGICSSAAILNVQPESNSNNVDIAVVDEVDGKAGSDLETAESNYNAVGEVDGKPASESDLETAESALGLFGPKVVVINKGYGGYRGGGHRRGCGCAGYGGSSHYHSHYGYYGKKK